jgi:hypothetical protein
MIIVVTPDKFEEEFRIPWKRGVIKSPSIDYATNAIHGWFEGRDVILFKFKNYGFIHDNRSSTYDLSVGVAGIMINITNTSYE